MLHEVLLALSGHPSPLFDERLDGHAGEGYELPLSLSTSEQSLLASIGSLSELHRKLRTHLDTIASQHASIICRAVAHSIRQVHLSRFQKKILDVERKILMKDTGVVGAYDIVPLAFIVGEFDDWHRRMAYYWDLAYFMDSSSDGSRDKECTGAAIIDKLRVDTQTGYLDIEEAARELSQVAEAAWLRQVSAWLLYGTFPSHGRDDFFVRQEEDPTTQVAVFRKIRELLPKFVHDTTGNSILFIGKCLNQISLHKGLEGARSDTSTTISRLSSKHMRLLSSHSLPLQPAQLNRVVSAIRLSLSQNVLQHMLPVELTLRAISCLHQFFLLRNGEFALLLIHEAESKIEARWQSMGRLLKQDPLKALQSLAIKDTELNQALLQTWKSLAIFDTDGEDDVMEFARQNVSLSAPIRLSNRQPTSDINNTVTPKLSTVQFNDLLFPSSSTLQMKISPPLDLLLSPTDVDTYSAISSYLLSIRRAQLRLGDLWRRSSARRHHPAPLHPKISNTDTGRARISQAGARARQQAVELRKVWATCSAALFLLSETLAYFEGEVVQPSWEHFESWIVKPQLASDLVDDLSVLTDLESTSDAVQRDPETMASGHRAFVASLTHALLLTDVPYTKELRSLLGNVDQLTAYFGNLLDVQQKRSTETDQGGSEQVTAQEERKTALELDRARKRVDSDLKSIVTRLRQIDRERIGNARYLDLRDVETGGFEPWKGGGVDRLLMKLEFGRVADEGFEIF